MTVDCEMKRIAILMTCHNRVETTLKCLKGLFASAANVEGCAFQVFLVDDGSTDGTGGRVGSEFPQGKVIGADGSLCWAMGMALAWRAAAASEDWDAYLWLNDDTGLYECGLAKMLSADDGAGIVVGDLQDASGKVVYGLRDGGIFTGNCVLVPRKAYEKLGMICDGYVHAWADSDYALLAGRHGVEVCGAGVVGAAEGHPHRPSLKGLTLRERLRMLRDPKGWNLHDLWLYRKRNWGVCMAFFSCVHLVAHVVKGEK